MGKWRTETLEMSITFTTNGEVVNRITGSRSGYEGGGDMKCLPGSSEVLIAYLEQFCGKRIEPLDKQGLIRAIENTVNNYLKEQ